MGILIIAGFFILVIFVILLINAQKKEADAEAISEAIDIFRRIGCGDRKAATEDWEHLKKTERKSIICEAWDKVEAEFQEQGNTKAIQLLMYYTGNEIIEYLKEISIFYENADKEAQNYFKQKGE